MLRRSSFIIAVFLIICSVIGCASRDKSISRQEAQRIAETVITDKEKAGINNFDSPEIEKLQEKNAHEVVSPDNKKDASLIDIKGKTVWKVTYHTGVDSLLGPIVVYIDYYTGKIYGFGMRF